MRLSLEGLSVGDAFGERFFGPVRAIRARLGSRELPPPPWGYTDDTVMALGVAEVLGRHGRIDQDDLALTFARRYRAAPGRGYDEQGSPTRAWAWCRCSLLSMDLRQK